jgi:hypothetical protein
MARFASYNWDTELGVCKKHMLPSVPCPACMVECEDDPDMYLELDPIERHLDRSEILIPKGFNPTIHEVL